MPNNSSSSPDNNQNFETPKIDFFVSYNGKDKQWAEWIAQLLEESGYTTILQAWDFEVGSNFVIEMDNAIKSSDRTIAVLSQNYIDALYTHPEWAAAFAKDPTGVKRNLIPIRIGEANLEGLFSQIVYLDLVGHSEEEAQHNVLAHIKAIKSEGKNKRRIPETRISFPGSSVSYPSENYPAEQQNYGNLNLLPVKDYREFIGREDMLQGILEFLNSSNDQMLAITGMGGMGKTALIREVMERQETFKFVVWTSAKREKFIGASIKKIESEEYSLENILNDILDQLGFDDEVQLPLEEKLEKVKELLYENEILIVMDNMESVYDKEELIDEVYNLCGRSKILVTSRHDVKLNTATNIKLEGFNLHEGLTFITTYGRDVRGLVEAEEEHLHQIYHATGGLPLAMKLVIGQISRQPIDVVLEHLEKVKFNLEDYTFYRFLYRESWKLLNKEAKIALVDISTSPSKGGFTKSKLEANSNQDTVSLWNGIAQLVEMSLVDKGGVVGDERFSLHTLTRNFVLSDITEEKKWEEE